MPAFVVPAILATRLAPLGLTGAGRIAAGRVPALVRQVLTGLGVAEGVDLILPGNQSLSALGGLIGGGNDPPEAISKGSPIVKRWEANGNPFVKFADGRLAARRADGTWSVWKPRKPIVIYPGAGNSLKNILKAFKASTDDIKKIDKAIQAAEQPITAKARAAARKAGKDAAIAEAAKQHPHPSQTIIERGRGDVIALPPPA